MKKLYSMLVAAMTAASIFLPGCGSADAAQADNLLDEIKQRGYILISTDPNYEPRSSLNIEGKRPLDTDCSSDTLTTTEMQGFDVDIAKAIGDHLNVATCFSTPSWEQIARGSWADQWDVSVGSMAITTERQKLFDFSVPYYYAPAVVAVLADGGFKSLEDLASHALCVGVSTTYEAWLHHGSLGPDITVYAKAPDNITVVQVDTDRRCPKALANGSIDFVGYVTSEIVVDADVAAGIPVVKLDGPVFYERFAAAFDKSSSLSTETLRAEVDKLLTKMHSDGTLTELSKKWFKAATGEPVDYTVESK
jgi:polar amino acid transport system substrate-binding protein